MPETRIAVVGSINLDVVTPVEHIPRPGQTVTAKGIDFIPGGKGANQSVAAARLGARVTHFGRVGEDSYGEQLRNALNLAGVDTSYVEVVPQTSSGLALITVDASGENSITIVPGANGEVRAENIQAVESELASADAILMQLELPLETVLTAAQTGNRAGKLTVLDPAPAQELPGELYQVSVFTPNQSEAEFFLSGTPVTTAEDAALAAREFRRRGAEVVVIKMGAQGAFLDDGRQSVLIAAPSVSVVDTTAAGDAFTAALAVFRLEGKSWGEAVELACVTGSLATTVSGAQPSMPSRAEVLARVDGPA